MSIVRLKDDVFLSTDDGTVFDGANSNDVEVLLNKKLLEKRNLSVKKTISKILGIDQLEIDLSLSTKKGNIAAKNGFFVEVYLSGTDGKLTRLFQQNIVDASSGENIRESFEKFIDLKVK